MNRWSFSKFAWRYQRDKLKLIDFDDFDHIYMVLGVPSNVLLGYISEPVGGIES